MPATLFGKVMRKSLLQNLFFFILFTSCYKDHLYVQQEWVDRNFLASSHVDTPDPRQADPPQGQRILVAWRFPQNLIDRELQLILTVRFWDNQQEDLCVAIEKGRGYKAFNFFNERILTYRLQVVDAYGDCIEVWEHQFWTKLIDIDRSNSSVSSQPIQGSVMDRP